MENGAIDTWWPQAYHTDMGAWLYERTYDRLWGEPNSYDLKQYIREWVGMELKMAPEVKNTIIKEIQSGPIWNWSWLIWVILLWADNDVKCILKKRILHDKAFSIKRTLAILQTTQILKGSEFIFRYEEKISETNVFLRMWMKNRKWEHGIAKVSIAKTEEEDELKIEYAARKELVEKIFDYFIDTNDRSWIQ